MFFEESEELLEQLIDGLGLMAAGQADDETVNAVFRSVHSIKGGAGAFGFSALVDFSHRFETVLDAVRSHRLEASAGIVLTLQRSADFLTDLVERARRGDTETPEQADSFLAALDQCLTGASAPDGQGNAAFGFAAQPILLDLGEPEAEVFEIRFKPFGRLYSNGHNPAMIVASLADLGEITTHLRTEGMGELADFDPAAPCLGWLIELETSAPESKVREVFDFVDGLCDLHISTRSDEAAAPEPQPQAPPASSSATQANSTPPPAARPAQEPAESTPKSTLRVELDRVDRLINAVGELIINQSMIAQRLQELRLATDADVVTHVEDYRLLARDIQEAVMAIRAQPVKPLFQRMSRIVREAEEATGKKVRLQTSGEGTEVDKTVVERLSDPLTHMVRNSVDHGLEKPEARLAAGKDPVGTITLSAMHRSGMVVITIRDDGAGLNRPKILEIARSKGLVAPDLELADSEIDALLFMPGFSTADQVSNLSGRGVGLDVVKNAVSTLGGRIAIATTPGQGTEFIISLPLTLAVLDGMVVSVAAQTLVIPITSILETIVPEESDVHQFGASEQLLFVRGRYVPLVDVAEGLGLSDTRRDPRKCQVVLMETEEHALVALMVDRIHDQRQVVIKGLESNYGTVPGVSAATVLGDGQVALILDPDVLARNASSAAPSGLLRLSEGMPHAASH